jgi:prepilin-type N-terminal cleavage/methylation domain-containing protein/prepilin-type processing-associated H-X9-DG protein
MNQKKGFTLIELLVVISIIALLLAIMMPALSTAKNVAAGIICTSNEKQMVLGWILYAEENNGKFCDSRTPGGDAGQSSGYWSFVAQPQNEGGGWSNVSVEDKIRGFKRGAIWEYLQNAKLYNCPSDTRYKEENSDGEMLGYRTYSIGVTLSPFLSDLYKATGNDFHGQRQYAVTNTAHIRNPSRKFVFLEETEKQRPFNDNTWDVFLDVEQWCDPFAILHNNSSTFGYADGHADRHKWTQQRTRDMAEKGAKTWMVVDENTYPGSTAEDYYWLVRRYIPGIMPRVLF